MKLLENTQEITSVPELYFTDILRGPRYTIYIKKFPESSATPIQKRYKKMTQSLRVMNVNMSLWKTMKSKMF